MCRSRCTLNCITPPYLLKRLLDNDDPRIRNSALTTMLSTAGLRGERQARAGLAFLAAPASGRRTISDCRHLTNLAFAKVVRSEGAASSGDGSVDRAYDGFGKTRAFYMEVFKRDSIDDKGMRLNGFVHYGSKYNNAFWDGQEMVFGEGDGLIFSDFTKSIDVIGHELTHGVTEFTAGLEYHNQSGALNESMSDVFGSLVKQHSLKQTAAQADWLIGAEIFTPGISADALRSMKAPGTAFDNNIFGKDPQPDHMRGYENLPDTEDGDWGGVHINSGIPNKAFHTLAMSLGGHAWEAAGHVWYESLIASHQQTEFQEFADTTFQKAGQLYGTGSAAHQSVALAWDSVGIRVNKGADGGGGGDHFAELQDQISKIALKVGQIAADVEYLRSREQVA